MWGPISNIGKIKTVLVLYEFDILKGKTSEQTPIKTQNKTVHIQLLNGFYKNISVTWYQKEILWTRVTRGNIIKKKDLKESKQSNHKGRN